MTAPLLDRNATAADDPIYRKIAGRIMPFIILCYFFAYLDRVNVAFAKLQMASALHLSDAVYGFGAGVFFIAYLIFEVPSNLIMEKVGARRWLARIMITWGILSAGMMFITTPMQFYVMRFLLGVAEAGFFPGLLLYLSQWFPSARRGKIVAILMAAVPVSGVIGGPISGMLLDAFNGSAGLAGWQWLFLMEGVPATLLGIGCLFLLNDGVKQAKWLSEPERELVSRQLAEESSQKQTHSFAGALSSGRFWLLALIYFCIGIGTLGLAFWMPTILKDAGVKSASTIGWLSAIPNLATSVAMVLVGRSADARHERRYHVTVPMFLGAVALILAPMVPGLALKVAMLTVATAGLTTALPMFWALPSSLLGGTALAAGLALLNSAGAVAGFVGPFAIGWLKTVTHSTTLPLLAVGVVIVVGSLLVLTLPKDEVNH